MYDVVTIKAGDKTFKAFFPKKLEMIFHGRIPDFQGWTENESRDIATIHVASQERAEFAYTSITGDTKQYHERLENAMRHGDYKAVALYADKVKTERHFTRLFERIGVTLRAVWDGKSWYIAREYTGEVLSLNDYNARYQGPFLVREVTE